MQLSEDEWIDLAEIDDVPPAKQLAAIAIALLIVLVVLGGVLSGCTTSGDVQKRSVAVEELAAWLEEYDQTPAELGCHYSPALPRDDAVRCYEIGR